MRRKVSIILLTVLAALVAAVSIPSAQADQEATLFRIGTGGTGGTYYPVGQAIVRSISNPTDASVCAPDPCGVPHLLAVAQTSNGSVANIEDIQSRKIESGFSQSDIAYWAHTGTGVFADQGALHDVAAIASLYREDIHLVARKGSGIERITDLRGMRVSLDDPGSGTLVDARIILDAYGIQESDILAQYVKPSDAIKKIRAGELDAFFIVAGSPSKSISELSAEGLITLVPIDGAVASRLTWENAFFSSTTIPAGSYNGIGTVRTLSVAALWIVSMAQNEEQVYQITKTFWENLGEIQTLGLHPKLKYISMKTALSSMGVPLHPGALRYYQEIGQTVARTGEQ